MMHMFALWLCQPTTRAAQLTAADLQTLPLSLEESRWLWGFLNKKLNRHKLLERAAHLAELNDTQKDRLRDWINATSRIGRYFEAAPIAPAMPVGYPFAGDPYAKAHQKNLQDLMEAFYNKGLKDGLPYLADGTPTGERSSLLKYQHFCDSFLALHKGDKDQDARHVCVMCGGELRNVEVDHWIPKSAYPLLAVCAENLVPICGELPTLFGLRGQARVEPGLGQLGGRPPRRPFFPWHVQGIARPASLSEAMRHARSSLPALSRHFAGVG